MRLSWYLAWLWLTQPDARATCGFRTVPKGDVCLHPFFTAIAIPEDSMTTKKPRKKPIKHLNINPPGSGITTRVFFGKKFVTIKVSIPSRRLDPHLARMKQTNAHFGHYPNSPAGRVSSQLFGESAQPCVFNCLEGLWRERNRSLFTSIYGCTILRKWRTKVCPQEQ